MMTPARLAATYRIVAVDGADGTGKTTLVNRLRAEHGFTIIHNARTPDGVDLPARYRRILATPGPLALDRCFVSELVYGPLYHGRSRITREEAVELAHTLTARQGVFVHVTAAAETICGRLLARDATSPDLATLDELLVAYEQVFTTFAEHVPVIRIDTTGTSPTG